MAVDLPTVVVVDEAPRALSTLREAEARALAAWRASTGTRSVDLPAQPPVVALPIDPERPARIARIERVLHESRGSLDLADPKVVADVRAELASAYGEARGHPEDPEAPFLAAEVLRALARAEELAGDAEGARALRMRAAVLDGGRSIGLSEGGPLDVPPGEARPFALTLLDAPAGAATWIDGERRDGALSLAAGEHHLRVVAADGRTLAARWFFADAVGLTLRVGPPVVACTAGDLAPALTKTAGFSVSCASWVRVVPHASSLEIRVCSAHDCGPPSTWSTVAVTAAPKPVVPENKSVWRSGWTWAAIGAAAAAVGTVAAWRLGAFDRGDSPAPTWRWEGAK